MLGIVGRLTNGGGTDSSPPDLIAAVEFNGSDFRIKNLDSFEWRDCRFRVNGDFEYHLDRLAAQELTAIDARQFASKDGKRFNPFDLKAKRFSASCALPSGQRSAYYGTWKD